MAEAKKPRGIRNNNPFNIDYNTTPWEGLDEPPTDGRFCRFISPEFGIRAGCRVLLTYQNKHGLHDVTSIVNRFAPPVENDTWAYINSICKALGVRKDEPIKVDNYDTMRKLVDAIIKHENGYNPYSDAIIAKGMAKAGIKPTPKEGTA